MSKNTYFAQYQSPNIIIVPTVSFSSSASPGIEKVDLTLTSSLTNCEEIAAKDNNCNEPSPSGSSCNQQNLNEVVNKGSSAQDIERTGTSESSYVQFRNSLFKIQDTISTEASSNTMSQSIKELSSSKYKSRNNLVDLTGFNMLKRDSASSLTKRKDSRWNDNTKIEQDKKTSDEIEHRDCSDNNTYKTDNISKHGTLFEDKESSKNMIPPSSHCEGSADDCANSESKENTIDMEDKMKKYFRHLWKRNIEKLKDKSTKEKPDRDLKSRNRIKQDSKDSKPESTRSKANLQRVSKNNTTKYLKNKITDGSKKYHDLERKFIAEYSRRSKIETNSSLDSKEFISDRETNLSPVSIKRYKDFQRFIRRHNDDHENKYKTGNRTKTKNLPDKKIRMKSCETTENKKDLKKKIDIRNQSIKNEQNSKGNTNQTNMEGVAKQTNTEKVKLIKSVVRINKNPPKSQQSKCVNGEHDLRSRLSRKRTKSECFAHSQQSVVNKLNRENLVITVKQDVKADSKNSGTLAPKEIKPKTKKCKKIKLIINIECTNSDSDDTDQNLNECCTSPQDLSFLDDFNVDEIVDSLNNSNSQVEHNKTTDNTKPKVLNKINENDNKNKCNEETKSKEGTDMNKKAIKIKKEETGLQKDQVIVINSDTEDEDLNLEIGSVANTKTCKDIQKMKYNSKIDTNIKQEANNITDLTENSYKENAQEEKMDLCNDSDDSVQEVIDITDDKTSENSLLPGDMKCPESNKAVSNVDRIFELLTRSNRPSVKRLGTESAIKKPRNTVNINDGKKTRVLFRKHGNTTQTLLVAVENAFEIKGEKVSKPSKKTKIHLQKPEDPIEASLETIFNHTEQNNTGMRRYEIEQINTLDRHVKEENVDSQNSKDTVETSLENMFKNIERNRSIHKQIQPFNGSDKKSKKENLYLQKSEDAVEACLENIFNGTKQEAGINMDITQPNSMIQHIKRETDGLQIARKTIKVPLKTMSNKVDQKANNNKIEIELSNEAHKHIKTEYSQKNLGQVLPVTTENSTERKANIKIDTEKSQVSNIKENLSKIEKFFETEENMLDKKANNTTVPQCRSDKKVEENKEHTKKPLFKSMNNIEKKTNNIVHSQPSNKNIKHRLNKRHSCKVSTKKTLENVKSYIDQKAASQMDIRPQSSVSQNNKPKREETVKSFAPQKATSRMDIRQQISVSQNNKAKEEESIKSLIQQKVASRMAIRSQSSENQNNKAKEETMKRFVQQKATSQIDIRPQSNVSQNNTTKREETVGTFVQKAASRTDIRPQSSLNQNNKGEETVKGFVHQKTASRMDIKPQSSVSQNNTAKEEETVKDFVQQKTVSRTDIRPQSSVNQNNKGEKTMKGFVQQKTAFQTDIRPQSSVSQNNKAKREETVESCVQQKVAPRMDIRSQCCISQNKTKEETMKIFVQQKAACRLNIRPQSSVSQNNKAKEAETMKSFAQQKTAHRTDIKPQSSVSKNNNGEETLKGLVQQKAASRMNIRPHSCFSQNNTAKEEENMKSIAQQKTASEMDIRQQSSVSKNKKGEETLKGFVQQKPTSQMDIRPQSCVSQNSTAKEEEYINSFAQQKTASQMDIRQRSSVSKNKKGEETLKDFVQQKPTSQMDIRPQSCVSQNNTAKAETMKSFAQQKTASQMDIRPQSSFSQNGKAKGEETVKGFVEQKSTSQIDIRPQSSVNQNNKGEETVKGFVQQKTASQMDIRPQSCVSQNNTAKAETMKSFTQQKTASQIDIRPQSSVSQNNKAKEKHLQESKGSSLEATIDDVEQKPNIKSECNISVNIEAKTLLSLQNSEVISENLSETDNDNIQHKANITTNVELLTNTNKNTEDTFKKSSKATTEKTLLSDNKEQIISAKSNVEENQPKSLETVNNNIQMLEMSDDDLSKTKDTNKDSELDERAEMATNLKKEQVDSSNNINPDGRENTDFTESKQATKSNEVEVKSLQKTDPFFLAKLEARMFDYLGKKYNVMSVILNGRFSSIYKCKDNYGETYAVKVVNVRSKGILMEEMLFQLQKYRSRADSCVLYLFSGFEVNGRWCLLTEYYPKNLEQALHENMRSFHVDLVQILSRQLVDAVNMLTNYKIIHSDIKPAHILLNSANDRLKLCGFDRSNYSSCIRIIPSTGSPNYRAPEVILGFSEDHRIDVWSTAVVMFEMSTNKKLFLGHYNNEILFQQLCTLGSFDWSMVEQSRYKHLHFTGTSFIRKSGSKGQKSVLVHSFHRNKALYRQLFVSYKHDWARTRTTWQMTKDVDKLETLHTLLEQMLALDPRHRLPIQFVGASEFIHDAFA